MPQSPDQILTVAQMRAAEEALGDSGISVDELMQRAGRGAADSVWRIAAHRRVTVLCGPGNNGGDGYVIAEAIRERGGRVAVVASAEPKTDAARNARAIYQGEVFSVDADPHGDMFVDCMFGSGLTRPLWGDQLDLYLRLAASHRQRIAIDLPSGVHADSGELLNEGLPNFDLTIALGAWKFAHFLMPASTAMGELRMLDIGCGAVEGAAQVLTRPKIAAPAADAHKYRRGVLGVICGEMPGASVLAATSAQGAGAGYVKLLGNALQAAPPDLVSVDGSLPGMLEDKRISALLIGPGLGRDDVARQRLAEALNANLPCVLDADALVLLDTWQAVEHIASRILTPHEGELRALERNFWMGERVGSKIDRVRELAPDCGSVVVAKGPDTVIAHGDGRVVLAPRASSWLSVAGTGDVLAGAIASRLACGVEPFRAACQGVWLHSEAARLCGPVFTASQLAAMIPSAYAACL